MWSGGPGRMVRAHLSLMNPVTGSCIQDTSLRVNLIATSSCSKGKGSCQNQFSLSKGSRDSKVSPFGPAIQLARTHWCGASVDFGARYGTHSRRRVVSHRSSSRNSLSGAKDRRADAVGFSREHEERSQKWQCSASASSSSSTPAAAAESDADEPETDVSQSVQTIPTAVIHETNATFTPRPAGHVGFATFSGGSDSLPIIDDKLKPKAWWLLGPLLLVTSIVIPHIIVPYVLELVFDNVIITDFLAYFLMDAFFLAGAAFFLGTADKFERQRRAAMGQVATWKSPWPSSYMVAGLKGWGQFITITSLGLPLLSMLLVWSFGTGPASLAALGPYLCGLVVQQVAERKMHDSGSPVWPMVPILATVYRLHQLNRGSQLVLELLDSISVPDPSREVLAAAGSLEAVLRVLNILGILWLCNLAVQVFILPAFYSKWGSGPKPPERPPVWTPEPAPST